MQRSPRSPSCPLVESYCPLRVPGERHERMRDQIMHDRPPQSFLPAFLGSRRTILVYVHPGATCLRMSGCAQKPSP